MNILTLYSIVGSGTNQIVYCIVRGNTLKNHNDCVSIHYWYAIILINSDTDLRQTNDLNNIHHTQDSERYQLVTLVTPFRAQITSLIITRAH
jgi:hypothetical protein